MQASRDLSYKDTPRCPQCRNPMLSVTGNMCPLCGASLERFEVVSDDSTPYAKSQSHRYWRMVLWVCTAGSFRLGFLARMNQSKHSLRFYLWSTLMLTLACALVVFPSHGWAYIYDHGAKYPTGYPQPQGQGWSLLGKVPAPPVGASTHEVLVRLWWNPALLISSLAINLIVSFFLTRAVMSFVLWGSNKALRAPYRGEHRFSAALHYSTAHAFILLIAAVFYGSSVLFALSHIRQWDASWSAYVHWVPAVMIAATGMFLWWMWLIRLAHNVPPATQTRVSTYFGFWVPLLAVLVAVGWLVGQYYGIDFLAKQLGVSFY